MTLIPRTVLASLAAFALLLAPAISAQARDQWSPERANDWYRGQPWPVGCNFIPSTAINQLEMWQAETFDLETIDRELGWAEDLGFSSVRVFLHNIPWEQDREGFLRRIEQFLDVAERHEIGVMFVLLDSVWDPFPKAGPQRAPKPHVHNSGWVQAPGLEILKDPKRHGELEGYVKGIVGHFRDDKRVQVWDIINEPDNTNRSSYGRFEPENKAELALMLLKSTYAWARAADPSQPITSGVWQGEWDNPDALSPVNRFLLDESDVISFHSYTPLPHTKQRVEALKRYDRPILCTEYMARPQGSTFDPILGYFRDEKIGAYNWGFVSGKSQTIYPWDSWQKSYDAEPPVWFHDIFRPDGTPYIREEVDYIKGLTGKAGS